MYSLYFRGEKDSYLENSSHFGIYPLEQSIALSGDKFLKKYSSSDKSADSLSSVFFLFLSFFVVVLYIYLLMYFFCIF